MLLQRAQSNLTLAAQQYNAGLINEGLAPEERIDLDKLDTALPRPPPSLTLARF